MRSLWPLIAVVVLGCDGKTSSHDVDMAVSLDLGESTDLYPARDFGESTDLGERLDLLSLPTLLVSNAIVVPADPSKIVYPDDYQVSPSPATLVDPYCAVSHDPTIFPADFLGAFPLPSPNGAPLPSPIALGAQMKDYWRAGLNNVSLNANCGSVPGIHDAFPVSVDRLKKLGASYVAVTTYDFVFDATSPSPAFDPAMEQLQPAELSFIGSTASAAGLKTVLYMQVSQPDDVGGNLPPSPSPAYWSALLDGYTTRVVAQANAAEAAHFDAMTLNWIEYCVDLNAQPELVDPLVSKLTAALGQVRAAYSGKVLLVDHPCVIPADLTKLASMISSLDGIIVSQPNQILTPIEDQTPTVGLLVAKYGAFLDSVSTRWGGSGKPITLSAQIQAHRYFLETGWIEDTPQCNPDCVEKHLTIDFSIQAMGYEALLEAVKAKQAAGLNIVAFEPTGYWETDQLVTEPTAYHVFPDMSHTIRSKPAEALIYQWFKR